jgi:hypothetical protein
MMKSAIIRDSPKKGETVFGWLARWDSGGCNRGSVQIPDELLPIDRPRDADRIGACKLSELFEPGFQRTKGGDWI